MQQIELRESLEEAEQSADPLSALESMHDNVEAQYQQLQNSFKEQYQSTEYNTALDTVAKMQFFSKLLIEIEQREEELEDF